MFFLRQHLQLSAVNIGIIYTYYIIVFDNSFQQINRTAMIQTADDMKSVQLLIGNRVSRGNIVKMYVLNKVSVKYKRNGSKEIKICKIVEYI